MPQGGCGNKGRRPPVTCQVVNPSPDICCQATAAQCGDGKDPQKAVELSIGQNQNSVKPFTSQTIILVDQEEEEEKEEPPCCPPPCCCPPCCMPCCPCGPCGPCGQCGPCRPCCPCPCPCPPPCPPKPCAPPPEKKTCSGPAPQIKPICFDLRSKPCGEIPSTQHLFSAAPSVSRVKSQHSSCQTDRMATTCSKKPRCQAASCQTGAGGARICQAASVQTIHSGQGLCQSQTASCQTFRASQQEQPCQTCEGPCRKICGTNTTQPEKSSICQQTHPCHPCPQKRRKPCGHGKSRPSSGLTAEATEAEGPEMTHRHHHKHHHHHHHKSEAETEEVDLLHHRKSKHKHHHHKRGSGEKRRSGEKRESGGGGLTFDEMGAAPAPIPEPPPPPPPKRKSTKKLGDKKGRSSASTEQFNLTECSGPKTSFVQYFLKQEGGSPYVTVLAETKLHYEKESKGKLAKSSKETRQAAQEFFLKIVDTINTPTPDTQNTEIKHFNIMKYLSPVLEGLHITADAQTESHAINKYHNHITAVAKVLEQRLSEKEYINPDCMVETETQLLAGIVSRFYPIFIKAKDKLVGLVDTGHIHQSLTPAEFLKHLRKLLLCVYVEIACIDSTFTTAMTMLPLPDAASTEALRQELSLRKKHARHATKWAARCLATTLLFYFMLGQQP